MNKLPNYENAIIPIDKFTNYALSIIKNKNKADAFKQSLGYTIKNAHLLIKEIKANIDKFPAKSKGDKGHGELYEVFMNIKGANGKYANMKTAWIVDRKTNETRLVSAYVSKKKLEG